jgi:hypothetical protein
MKLTVIEHIAENSHSFTGPIYLLVLVLDKVIKQDHPPHYSSRLTLTQHTHTAHSHSLFMALLTHVQCTSVRRLDTLNLINE